MKIKQLNKIYNRHNKNLNFRSRTTNTTNINILLNRVRQENKSNLKKKIILSISIISVLFFICILIFRI